MSLWKLVLICLKWIDVQVFADKIGSREAFNDWQLVFFPVVDGDFKWVPQNRKLVMIRANTDPSSTLGKEIAEITVNRVVFALPFAESCLSLDVGLLATEVY